MIRPVTNMRELVPLATDWVSRVEGMVGGFDAHWCISLWGNIVDSGIGEVFVQEVDEEIVSAFGLIASPGMNGTLEARQMFWMADKSRLGSGREMLNAAEAWCRDRNVQRLVITRLEWSRGASLDRLYRMAGYNPVERVFCKELV